MNSYLPGTPADDGMCRCQDCARTVPVTRSSPFSDRQIMLRGCGPQPRRPVLAAHRWRRCDLFRPKSQD